MSRLARASATTSSKARQSHAGRGDRARGRSMGGGRGRGLRDRAKRAAPGWPSLRRILRRDARRRLRRIRQFAQGVFGRWQIGRVAEPNQRHFRRRQRARRIFHVLHALQQNLPGARQRAQPEFLRKFNRAPPLVLADRRIVDAVRAEFLPRHKMAEFRHLDQNLAGIGAGLIEAPHRGRAPAPSSPFIASSKRSMMWPRSDSPSIARMPATCTPPSAP